MKSKYKILSVVGARPQFVKAAAISWEIADLADVEEVLVHTGQHYDKEMSEVFFSQLGMQEPRYNLNIGSGTHAIQTAEMMKGLERVFLQESPDCVMVFGDTNSTLAAALVASKLKLSIAHVEAGLRSFNRNMPEEINRVLTDHLSDWLFVPTKNALENLNREGLSERKVRLVGDVMVDVCNHFREKDGESVLHQNGLVSGAYSLVTIHRAENTDDMERLEIIFQALHRLATEETVVFPMHPRTRNLIESNPKMKTLISNVVTLPPVPYVEMLALQRNSNLVITDSGGMQKEAFLLGVPCVTVRDETEWVELIELGWNTLAPPHSVDELYQSFVAGREKKGKIGTPFGEVGAARNILTCLGVN